MVIGKGRGRSELRLNTERQVLWFSYDVCREKKERKELKRKWEKESEKLSKLDVQKKKNKYIQI
jgi:hypothetical protein